MKNLSRVILVFVLLLLVTSIVAAGAPELESFSTTGYTRLDPIPIQEPLPSGYIKFHLFAVGDPDDSTCLRTLACAECGLIYPDENLWKMRGSFIFEEWGLILLRRS